MSRSFMNRRAPSKRHLRVEPLERRTLLAVMVGTADEFVTAINDANGDPTITEIQFEDGVDAIELGGTVTYTGGQALTITGDADGVTIGPTTGNEGAFNLFESTGDADLTLKELTFDGGLNGVLVDISAAATGVVSVVLEDVAIQNCGAFGLHVSDGAESDASIDLTVSGSTITGNGTAVADSDGIRVDETGEGDIVANVSDSDIVGNGGDGLELDEQGAGDVKLHLSGSTLNGNGFFDPDDLDDGLDIDEAGDGSVKATIVNSEFNGNFDQGVDLDEEGAGSMIARFANVDANDNIDSDGIKMSEEDAGGLNVRFTSVRVNTNGGEGIQLEEANAGSVNVQFNDVQANGNSKEGIQIEETGAGSLNARLAQLEVIGNEDDGVQIDEEDNGGLNVAVVDSILSDNDKYGVKVEQAGKGGGLLSLLDITFGGNGDGESKVKGVKVR